MAARGHPQPVVDDMELWVVARIMQMGSSEEDRFRAEAEADNAERVRAAEAGVAVVAASKPEGPVVDDETADAAIAALHKARAERKAVGAARPS